METIKNILIDSLNGFSVSQIPLFIFQLLAAGIMGYLIQLILKRKLKEEVVQYGALIAMGSAFLGAIAKYSLPFSVMAAAVLLMLANKKDQSKHETIGLFLVASIGITCGVGSVIYSFIGFILISCVILFMPIKK